MGLISSLSLRNLLRQKRRNLFLGIGITFGMIILVIANSFSHGMADVIINDLVAYGYGHLVLGGTSENQAFWIFRDGPRIKKIVNDTIGTNDEVRIIENLSVQVRVIGHGETDNLWISGYTPQNIKNKAEFFYNKNLSISQGNIDDYFNKDIEYPVIVFEEEAKLLNIKLHDKLLVIFPMVTGQIQTAQLTVVAFAKTNISLMNLTAFMDINRTKNLLDYKPWESASLQITLKNPEISAKKYAVILREKLKPNLLSIVGKIDQEDCQILAFNNNDQSKEIVKKNIRIIHGDLQEALGKDGVIIPDGLAKKLHLQMGSEFIYKYYTKYRGIHQENFVVNAFYHSAMLDENIILMNGERIFNIYNRYLPEKNNIKSVNNQNPLYAALATEWEVFAASKDNEELQQKYLQNRFLNSHQAKYDVVTMYEGAASDVLKLESVLNLLTFIAVLVLFFIVLIGVINTLRMTIRERTREIGTVRAIGMQKNDVRNMFVMETLLLTAIACFAGIILGIIITQILGAIHFKVNNDLSILLKDGHLTFKLNWMAILFYFLLIMAISAITAYFPAKRAAKLPVVEALRQYE
jgi:ABC-type lipoprotein release transport system permease subunit